MIEGINIEPNPDQFERFNKLMPEDINLNLGISDKKDRLTYYKFNAPALNTFDKKHFGIFFYVLIRISENADDKCCSKKE
ncbi:MAG: hypothetical protein K2X86_11990 [Cytophagaceae bacterium]|nr:hypothetical protein [Cytophagaceae bacterium]